MATCGIVIPRYDRSILVLLMDVIQFPFDNVVCGGLFVCARVLVLYNDQIHLNLQFILLYYLYELREKFIVIFALV